jgi:hypothetical protein
MPRDQRKEVSWASLGWLRPRDEGKESPLTELPLNACKSHIIQEVLKGVSTYRFCPGNLTCESFHTAFNLAVDRFGLEEYYHFKHLFRIEEINRDMKCRSSHRCWLIFYLDGLILISLS